MPGLVTSMHWRNWVFLGIAATIAVLTIETARQKVQATRPALRRQLDPDDRKPDWYHPKETRPAEKKPSEPIGPG
ncbi:hypothetical protein [Roseiterribacter gracilis]|uniref:Uncharacterized protein n=1 Tax=Roseiterribacter gracilis TaxID=2812848 RepID=A0A8S8XA79_9PROT|nr:hypothetical protein TMPK1_04620 [Rhodospirillales bacterium TMPK1]